MAISREQLEKRLIARAWKDDSFRKALVADAKAAIKQELGADAPAILDKMTIQVIEEAPGKMCLIIPAGKPDQSSEMALGDLQAVAGGGNWRTEPFTSAKCS